MDLGKLGGLGNLGTLASFGALGKGSNNFLIWILLAVVVFGFGKGKSVLGPNFFQVNKLPEVNHHSRRRYRGAPPAAPVPLAGFGGIGTGGLGGILGGNGLFIVIVVVLLILCKDEKSDDHRSSYANEEDYVNE